MPKELIHDRFNGQTYKVLDPDAKTSDAEWKMTDPEWWALRVGWSRDTDAIELAPVELNETGVQVNEVDAPDRHIWLDRAGINSLIRVLRKARDQAFGADA